MLLKQWLRSKNKTMNAVGAPVKKGQFKSSSKTDKPWQVVVLDDPVNLMEYVSRVLVQIFGISKGRANELMLAVHEKGRATVWSGSREKGEMYVSQLHTAQLNATLEKVE